MIINTSYSTILYFSNETCILQYTQPANFTTIVCQENGSLAGLDVDTQAGLIFWSNNADTHKGIYSATLNGSNVTKIFDDTLMVNGLAADRIGRRIYWSDEDLQYIQSCDYDGSNMRIVVYEDVSSPRGLAVDHVNGWLYWNDQNKHTVEMSKLYGSRRNIIGNPTDNKLKPNQMALIRYNESTSKLYFVDANDLSVKSISLTSSDNTSRITTQSTVLEFDLGGVLNSSDIIYGLAVDGEIAYVTSWGSCSLVKLDLNNKTSEIISSHLGTAKLFSLAVFEGNDSSVDKNSMENNSSNPSSNGSTQNSTVNNNSTVNHNPSMNDSTQKNSTVDNSTQNNSTQNNSTQNNSTQNNSTQNNSTQNNSTQNSSTQNNSTQNNSTQNNSTQNNSTQNNSTQNNSTQNNSTQNNSTQNNSTQNNSTQNNSTQNNSTQNNSTQNNSTQNNSTQNNSTQNNSTSSPNENNHLTCLWSNTGPCSHICIPMGPELGFKCACPTYGGLSLSDDGHNCTAPSGIVLIYADAKYGHVGWLDVTKFPLDQSSDLHLVARSTLPTAVAYDPLEKTVYWSDSKDRMIFKRPFNVSYQSTIFLGQSDYVDVVDGLSIDYTRRNLYFSNMDEATIDGTLYLKHSIEVVSLKDKRSRVIMARDVERPRGLWVDLGGRHLFYTDWGSQAKVAISNLDGTNSTVILSRQSDQIQNPNSAIRSHDQIFVIDSINATATLWYIDDTLPLLHNSSSIYNWTKTTLQDAKVPFGMTEYLDSILISDWSADCLWRYNLTSRNSDCFFNSSSRLLGITIAHMNLTVIEEDSSCCNANGTMCLNSGDDDDDDKCYCRSHGRLIMQSNSCEAPENFILIADMMSIKMVGWKTNDRNPYEFLAGNFANSFSSLAYDPTTQILFFSDVNQKTIRVTRMSESSGDSRLFYEAKGVIDDMLIYNHSLYWVDSQRGQLSRLGLSKNSLNWTGPHNVIASNLQSPKSLAVQELKGHFYWTSDSSPHIWRLTTDGVVEKFDVSNPSLFKSGPLFIGRREDALYLLDEHTGALLNCNISDQSSNFSCTSFVNLTGGDLFYSFAIVDDSVFYSNWEDECLYRFNSSDGSRDIVAQNLTRPTRFVIQQSSTRNISKTRPPYFIGCPRNIRIFTTSNQEVVWWRPPTLAGISDRRVLESLRVGIAPGTSMAPGIHMVKYSASDSDGLVAECVFNVSIQKVEGIQCSKKYSIINGDLLCDSSSSSSSSSLQCRVECYKNFVPISTASNNSFAFCASGQTNVFFCAESYEMAPALRSRINFSGLCPSDKEQFILKLFYAFYLLDLCSLPDKDYRTGADLCNRGNFRDIECQGRSRRDVDLAADPKFAVGMQLLESDDLKKKLDRLDELIGEKRFEVEYDRRKVKALNVTTNTSVDDRCSTNSYRVDNRTCAICPYGTMFDSGHCTTCPENTYQPKDGQSMCNPCPDHNTSPPGSYDARQCSPKEGEKGQGAESSTNVPLIIGLVVGLALGLLLVAILVMLACWHSKKKEQDMFEMDMRRRLDAQSSYRGDNSDDAFVVVKMGPPTEIDISSDRSHQEIKYCQSNLHKEVGTDKPASTRFRYLPSSRTPRHHHRHHHRHHYHHRHHHQMSSQQIPEITSSSINFNNGKFGELPNRSTSNHHRVRVKIPDLRNVDSSDDGSFSGYTGGTVEGEKMEVKRIGRFHPLVVSFIRR